MALAAVSLVIVALYHRLATVDVALIKLGGVWLVMAVLMLGLRGVRGSLATTASRCCVLVGASALALAAADAWVRELYTFAVGSIFGVALVSAVVGIIGWFVACANEVRWQQLRRALVAGGVAFVASQPVLASWRAPELRWPPSTGEPVRRDERSITLVLLLDELNARSSAPIVNMLEQEGLLVDSRAVATAGDGTSKAVPAMFEHADFSEARPCTLTAMCSSRHVLDFSKIHASRADIDLVGFYHPYCAIGGLRSCTQVPLESPVLRARWWHCAWARHMPWGADIPLSMCDELGSQAWTGLVADVSAAMWRAPVWTQGGLLMAHLPLPHLPGRDVRAPLHMQYADNIVRATELVRVAVQKARAEGEAGELRLVIFSDHPLRQGMWCATQPFASQGCHPRAELDDSQVPIIVAGNRGLPEITSLRSNAQVFDLLKAPWRRSQPITQ